MLMATQSKTQLLTNIHALLKKRYKPKTDPNASRLSVLKAVVYGICHEDTTREQANQALSRFEDEFFDWNELRVSSVEEIQETLAGIPDPEERAKRIRRFLRQLFNRTYGFTLDALAKKPLKEALKVLQTYDAFASDYVTATVIQQALGGHAIPIDKAAHRVLERVGISESGSSRSAGDPGAGRPQEPRCRVPRLDRRPRQRHLPGNRPGMSPLRAPQNVRVRSDTEAGGPFRGSRRSRGFGQGRQGFEQGIQEQGFAGKRAKLCQEELRRRSNPSRRLLLPRRRATSTAESSSGEWGVEREIIQRAGARDLLALKNAFFFAP